MTDLILPGKNNRNKMFDILPSEKNKIKDCIVAERSSMECKTQFSQAYDSDSLLEAVYSFARRLRSRIYDAGFVADVSTDIKDEDNYDIFEDQSGESTFIWHPKVTVLNRVDDKKDSYDVEKASYEVKHGVADGRVGRLKGGNVWDDDPDRKKVFGYVPESK